MLLVSIWVLTWVLASGTVASVTTTASRRACARGTRYRRAVGVAGADGGRGELGNTAALQDCAEVCIGDKRIGIRETSIEPLNIPWGLKAPFIEDFTAYLKLRPSKPGLTS